MQFPSLVLVLEKTSPPELCRAEDFVAPELWRSVCFLEKYGLAYSTIASLYMPTPRGVRLMNALRALNALKMMDQNIIETHLLGVFRNHGTKNEVCESLALEVTNVLLRLLNGENIHIAPPPTEPPMSTEPTPVHLATGTSYPVTAPVPPPPAQGIDEDVRKYIDAQIARVLAR